LRTRWCAECFARGSDLKAGVDAPSATKGGKAEAVAISSLRAPAGMSERRKRAGHHLKHRFLAAQMEAYCADDPG
jgi:threonine aldolase